jgi:hypothetical protein
MVAPAVHHGKRFRRVEVVLERSGKTLPLAFLRGLRRSTQDLAQTLEACLRRGHRLVREVDRLRPVAGQEVDEHRLAAPALEYVRQRRDVPDRLRHLLARQLEQTVVHPDTRELAPGSLRLRTFVLVMRKHEVEAAEMDLELRAKELLRHR